MRVRIRRFGGLRLAGKSRDSHPVVVARGQGGIEQLGGVFPPASRVPCHLPGCILVCTEALHFPVDGFPSLPLFQLHHPQTMANPLVETTENARRLRKSEVFLPTRQVAAQSSEHRFHASTTISGRDFSDPFLHLLKGLGRHAPLHLPSRSYPEAVAEEFPVPRSCDRALHLVDSQPELPVEPLERLHRVVARPPGPNVDVQIVSVADERQPASPLPSSVSSIVDFWRLTLSRLMGVSLSLPFGPSLLAALPASSRRVAIPAGALATTTASADFSLRLHPRVALSGVRRDLPR